jgi:hypothetical protein
VFDHSARDAEHLQNFLFVANPGFSGQFLASGQLFGILLPNAAPTGVRAAQCGKRSAGAAIMNEPTFPPCPAAPRSGEGPGYLPETSLAADQGWVIPHVRVGSGKRKTVLYPLADAASLAQPRKRKCRKGVSNSKQPGRPETCGFVRRVDGGPLPRSRPWYGRPRAFESCGCWLEDEGCR